MILLALAGKPRCGKNTVAEYLTRNYGFIPFAFSDNLYFEVSQAFGVSEEFLRSPISKDSPSHLMSLSQCSDVGFVEIATKILTDGADTFDNVEQRPLSPGWVLQRWGTEFRRVQDPNYWVKRAELFIRNTCAAAPYPEMVPQYFVECGTRFENEREWIVKNHGNVWHIRRDGIESPRMDHVAEAGLEVLEGERELWNNDSIERLYKGIDLLLGSSAQFVKVEPMAEFVPPAIKDAEVVEVQQ